MKHPVISAASILVLAVSIWLGAASTGLIGSFAAFSDVETSNANTLTAGTLNLTGGSPLVSASTGKRTALVPGGDGVNGFVQFANLAPGDSGFIEWSLENDGNLDAALTVDCTKTSTDVSQNEPELLADADDTGRLDQDPHGELDEFTGVKLSRTFNGDALTQHFLLGTSTHFAPLESLCGVFNSEGFSMDEDDGLQYRMDWSIASDIRSAGPDGLFDTNDGETDIDDNIIQSDRVQLDLIFTLTQNLPLFCSGRPATIVGTNAPDTLQGTSGDDVIVGLNGDDTIYGNGGNDFICGNNGDDDLYGGNGVDIIVGGRGDDDIFGGNGNDFLFGNSGNDDIQGENGVDLIVGGKGSDTCDGGAGGATLFTCNP